MLSSEELKPIYTVALSIVELHLVELVSQSVENSVKEEILKFHNNLLQGFSVNLKTCVG